MQKFYSCLFICFLCLTSVSDARSAKEVLEDYNSGGQGKNVALIFINGVGEGIMWTNAVMQAQAGFEFYCAPSGLRQNAEGYFQIFKTQYYRNEKRYKDVPPGLALVEGLINTFPCK